MSADHDKNLCAGQAGQLEPTVLYPGSAAAVDRSARRPKLLMLTGSGARDTAELQTLLRQRLRFISLAAALACALAAAQKLLSVDFRAFPSLSTFVEYVKGWKDLFALLICVVAYGLLAAVLWKKSLPSLFVLRSYELLIFGGGLVYFFINNRYMLNTGGWLANIIENGHLNILATAQSVPWFFLIVAYGTLIPNTGRRCAVVVSFFALFGLSITASSLIVNSLVAIDIVRYLLEMGIWMLLAIAIAIVGSHRLEALRQEASQARRLGQYLLKERLGAGGMGEVYLAEHLLLRRPCAVKLIRPERAGDLRDLGRFEHEVQTTATLSHPNTVQIYDYGHADDGTFYYAMEYLPGLTLDQLVERDGPLPPARAIHFLRQLCGSLREAHAVGLIHRDIKPGNVMICERGGIPDVAKLLDFGLVLSAAGNDDGAELTQVGALAGTPAYMSPEQAGGQANLDARSDIYSVGTVGYYLLTGQSPFAGRSAAKMLAAHLYESPTSITQRRPEVPPELESVILRCLAKNPADRYFDAASLEGALAACLPAELA